MLTPENFCTKIVSGPICRIEIAERLVEAADERRHADDRRDADDDAQRPSAPIASCSPRSVSHDIVTISLNRAQRMAYSRLRASIGSSEAARIAGIQPEEQPDDGRHRRCPSTTDHASTRPGAGVSMLMTYADDEAQAGADDAAECRERDRFGENLPEDVAPPRAERLAQPDLARPFADRPSA